MGVYYGVRCRTCRGEIYDAAGVALLLCRPCLEVHILEHKERAAVRELRRARRALRWATFKLNLHRWLTRPR